ncbi:hypothetical protein HMPREF1554_00977 [Porphyromonas gingivalis F0569]|nr:hypothetical protein HMPREF1554_00977 [Porphyromonas gingivalis F0569]
MQLAYLERTIVSLPVYPFSYVLAFRSVFNRHCRLLAPHACFLLLGHPLCAGR